MKEKNTAHKQKNKFVEFLSLLWRTKKVAFFGMVVLIFFILVAAIALTQNYLTRRKEVQQ